MLDQMAVLKGIASKADRVTDGGPDR